MQVHVQPFIFSFVSTAAQFPHATGGSRQEFVTQANITAVIAAGAVKTEAVRAYLEVLSPF